MSLFKKKETEEIQNEEVETEVEVQNSFNTDSIEEMNDEDTIIENINVEEEE